MLLINLIQAIFFWRYFVYLFRVNFRQASLFLSLIVDICFNFGFVRLVFLLLPELVRNIPIIDGIYPNITIDNFSPVSIYRSLWLLAYFELPNFALMMGICMFLSPFISMYFTAICTYNLSSSMLGIGILSNYNQSWSSGTIQVVFFLRHFKVFLIYK